MDLNRPLWPKQPQLGRRRLGSLGGSLSHPAPPPPRARPWLLRVPLRLIRLLGRVIGSALLATYILVSRSLVVVAALYLSLYFLAGSTPIQARLQTLVSEAIPGSLGMATLQWGPPPWLVRVAEPRILGARGEEVIGVRGLQATVHLGDTFGSLFNLLTNKSSNLIDIHLSHVDLLRPHVRVEVMEHDVGIALAFDDETAAPPAVASTAPETHVTVRADLVHIVDAGAWIEADGFNLEVAGYQGLTDFKLTTPPFGMEFDVPRSRAATADMTFSTLPLAPGHLPLAARDVAIDAFSWRAMTFTWQRATGTLDDGGPIRPRFSGRGGLDIPHDPPAFFGSGRIELPTASPLTAAFFGPSVTGPLDASITAQGTVEQLNAAVTAQSPTLTIGPFTCDNLSLAGRVTPIGTPTTPDRHALFVDHAEAALAGGHLALDALSWLPRTPDAPDRDLSVVVTATALDLGPLLAAALTSPLPPPWAPTLATASLTGQATLMTRPTPAATPGTTWSRAWTLDLAPTQLVFPTPETPLAPFFGHLPPCAGPRCPRTPTWELSGTLERHQAASGLLVAPTHVPAGASPTGAPPAIQPIDLLTLRNFQLDSGQDRARLAGRFERTSGALDLEPYLRLGDLSRLKTVLAPWGLPDPAGRLVLKAARLTGTTTAPEASATLNWTGARLGEHALERVSGHLKLIHNSLQLIQFQSQNKLVQFILDGHVDLAPPSPGQPQTFALRTRRLHGLLASALFPWLGPDARLSIDNGEARGLLHDPLRSLTASGRLTVERLRLGAFHDVTAQADLTMRPGFALTIPSFSFTLPSKATLFGHVRTGQLIHPNPTIDARIQLERASLADLPTPLPNLSAHLSADLTTSGTLAHPIVMGSIAARNARVADLPLGDARLTVTTHDDRLELSAFDSAFFPNFSLDYAILDLFDRDRPGALHFPGRLAVQVRAQRQNLSDLVPALDDSGLDLAGAATAQLTLDPGSAPALTLTAAPHELTAASADGATRWHNTTALLLTTALSPGAPHRLTLAPVTLAPKTPTTAPPPALTVCGSLDLDALARNTPDTLDLALSGSVDFALVPGLSNALSIADGRFIIAPDTSPAPSCLPPDLPTLRIRGALAAPVAIGRLQADDIALVPRGSGREIRLRDGATVLLRAATPAGTQRVVLGREDTSFQGTLDDGAFTLSGELLISSLVPTSFGFTLQGTDLFAQSPGEFALTASPTLTLTARHLETSRPELVIRGDVPLSDGKFSKSFDTFAQAVGGALGGRTDAYSGSFTDTLPWLGHSQLDLNVTAPEFQIQTALPLVRTDLRARIDLTVRGTLDAPRLLRRVDLLAGGTLTYLLFERTFTVDQGALDFDGDPERPVVDVTAQTAITYVQRAQTALQEEDLKEVTVILRMSGRVPDLRIELSSDDPTLDQADLQSLLLTGRPSRDMDRAQDSRLVSADLSSVINAVLSAPFVRTASVGLDQSGGLEYRVGTCFAPNLCFDTTTVSDDTETRLRARFSLTLGDDLVCEGTLRRNEGSVRNDDETYQARCRYRIPLK